MTAPVVGVVGASARAAVMSLARAGYSAWAVDLFDDRDLRRLAPVARCPFDSFPEGIPDLCEQFPAGPVLYTGGLENHPEVVRELGRRRPLWGNGPEVLAHVRDTWRLADILSVKGFASPRLAPKGAPCPAEGTWLAKRRRSSGGLGVHTARPGEDPAAECCFQEYVPGRPMSAVFASRASQVTLLGVTEQLIGTGWLHARPYRYAGNIGPVAVTQSVRSELALLGSRLVEEAGLEGLWGVDFILHEDRPWVVEVNPRYPASVEVLEAACGFAALGFSPPSLRNPSPRRGGEKEANQPLSPPSVLGKGAGGLGSSGAGKAIYFAPHDLVFPSSGPWEADLVGQAESLSYADIPEHGEVIPAGWPVLTFFARGSTTDECRAKLMERAAELDDRLGSQPARPAL
jgi:predicted ATP-grasp superfamily ATP-dependent carboligase